MVPVDLVDGGQSGSRSYECRVLIKLQLSSIAHIVAAELSIRNQR